MEFLKMCGSWAGRGLHCTHLMYLGKKVNNMLVETD